MSREDLLALVSAQAKTIEALTARLDVLETENAELKRQLGQNSSNCSRPPSSDAPWAKQPAKKRSSRARSGRKPGKQLGAFSRSRRLIDEVRSVSARRERESAVAEVEPGEVPDRDDTLLLLFLCCHPALTPASQIALTLRAVGGLATAEIARAFLVPEATMTRRISRAKQQIKDSAAPFRMPAPAEGASLSAGG